MNKLIDLGFLFLFIFIGFAFLLSLPTNANATITCSTAPTTRACPASKCTNGTSCSTAADGSGSTCLSGTWYAPASCGTSGCWYYASAQTAACGYTAPTPTPVQFCNGGKSCGACSVSCGGGQMTCTYTTYNGTTPCTQNSGYESCNTQSCSATPTPLPTTGPTPTPGSTKCGTDTCPTTGRCNGCMRVTKYGCFDANTCDAGTWVTDNTCSGCSSATPTPTLISTPTPTTTSFPICNGNYACGDCILPSGATCGAGTTSCGYNTFNNSSDCSENYSDQSCTESCSIHHPASISSLTQGSYCTLGNKDSCGFGTYHSFMINKKPFVSNPTHLNFGDYKCDLLITQNGTTVINLSIINNQIYSMLARLGRTADYAKWKCVVEHESHYNANAYYTCLKYGQAYCNNAGLATTGAWGMFQMDPYACYTDSYHYYKTGNVKWDRQISDALNFNYKSIGGSFSYWQAYTKWGCNNL